MSGTYLGWIDTAVIVVYAVILVLMGIYFFRKSRTSEGFMVAGRSIPSWAAGLAVMSAYTSSISYIATPGKAFDTNWHPLIFALCIIPVTWLVSKYALPYYQKTKLISVYSFLEERLGNWARAYAGISFLLYMTGRIAVILYLSGLLLSSFLPQSIIALVLFIGLITIIYTLLGGMEAVIWTDVMQSAIMIIGLLYVGVYLSLNVLGGSHPLIHNAIAAHKFSLGSLKLSLSSRTVWVMVIYGVTENLRNLMADQNYVQKYASVGSLKEARRSIWTAMAIYIPMTMLFLYIGTALFAFYSNGGLPDAITKGDQVFPHFIATQVHVGLKGLIVAAIIAAAMSTIDSGLNCSATIALLDFQKRYFKPNLSEKSSLFFLRAMTVVWGVLGTALALLMLNAKSALDVWWTISGIFGGGILGLFLIAFFKIKIKTWHGVVGIVASILAISWATFARNLPANWQWAECRMETIIIGAFGTTVMLVAIILSGYLFPGKEQPAER
ncbi:MAG: sodium/solute symporter [Calditrichaeota bacterium]|nr:sodium/solute symporter [Calditrichota bacterium]